MVRSLAGSPPVDSASMTALQAPRIPLMSVHFDSVTEADVVSHVTAALDRGEGGRIITPNADILRLAGRDAEARQHIQDATLVVADGMPLLWASKLAGSPLPERVAGSSLIFTLSAGLAAQGR